MYLDINCCYSPVYNELATGNWESVLKGDVRFDNIDCKNRKKDQGDGAEVGKNE